ncbi:hypothetical protein RJT34_30770 [Clitoria ternatea]|uniref:Uncharacterized protein n=1 Tax=Clitoria ternatea TaxID=43366 RepID=A0AAN9I2Y6_CLITE
MQITAFEYYCVKLASKPIRDFKVGKELGLGDDEGEKGKNEIRGFASLRVSDNITPHTYSNFLLSLVGSSLHLQVTLSVRQRGK